MRASRENAQNKSVTVEYETRQRFKAQTNTVQGECFRGKLKLQGSTTIISSWKRLTARLRLFIEEWDDHAFWTPFATRTLAGLIKELQDECSSLLVARITLSPDLSNAL